MPMFFFDYHESEQCTRDERGREFPDRHKACEEALRSLPQVARTAFADSDGTHLRIVVRDAANSVIFASSLRRADIPLWDDPVLPDSPIPDPAFCPNKHECRPD